MKKPGARERRHSQWKGDRGAWSEAEKGKMALNQSAWSGSARRGAGGGRPRSPGRGWGPAVLGPRCN